MKIITPTDSLRNLIFLFDPDLAISKQVSSCFDNIGDLCYMRKFIVQKTTTILITSHLDFTNKHVCLMQYVCRSHFVCKVSRFSRIIPLLKSQHWLPVEFRIIFKINLLSYKTITTGFPKTPNCY